MDLQEGCYNKDITVVGDKDVQGLTSVKQHERDLREFSGDSTETLVGSLVAVEVIGSDRNHEVLEVHKNTGWTNDKHESYIISMEQEFIRSLYNRENFAPTQALADVSQEVVVEEDNLSSSKSNGSAEKLPVSKQRK